MYQRQIVHHEEFGRRKDFSLEKNNTANSTKEGMYSSEGIRIRKGYEDTFVVQRES